MSEMEKILALEGELTIERAGEIRTLILNAIQETQGRLTIDVGRLGKVDIFGLQILCSTHRLAVKLKREFVFKGTPSVSFREALKLSSYGQRADCTLASACLCCDIGGARNG